MTKTVVGVTGPNGFIAGHLLRHLSFQEDIVVTRCPREAFSDAKLLGDFVNNCDVVIHLAAVNRGSDEEIGETNSQLIDRLLAAAGNRNRKLHIVFSSSTQNSNDNVYGSAKRYCERRLAAWVDQSEYHSASVLVIPNVYGPGCRPFYNSVVATFCHQLSKGEQPQIVRDSEVEFLWINDLVAQIVDAIRKPSKGIETQRIPGSATLRVSELLTRLTTYRDSQSGRNFVPDISDPLDASLYATYLYYVSVDEHCHSPTVHRDQRGMLFEIIRLANGGQVFFSTTKPGITRGDHFHTRKIEWFCVLKGEAAIRLRQVDESEVHEFRVSGDLPRFVTIPVLYSHQIENVGKEDLLTMFWCNEIYDAEDPDTYFEKVA